MAKRLPGRKGTWEVQSGRLSELSWYRSWESLRRKLVWMDRKVPDSAVGGQNLDFYKLER